MSQRQNALQMLLTRLRQGQLTGDMANLEEIIARLTDDDGPEEPELDEQVEDEDMEIENHTTHEQDRPSTSAADTPSVQDSAIEGMENPDTYSGQLIAIKLTGDPNIPRGQITFLAPDLSDKGLIRTAQEEIFRGARIVKSAGHIADRGYRNGKQLYFVH